jgi:hypothetical protein
MKDNGTMDKDSYRPDSRLYGYMKEKLRLEKIKDEIREGKRNQPLSEDDEKLESTLKTVKSRTVLDKIVFPAMANLTYFVGTVGAHKELQRVFEDDLKDLFGIRRKNPQKNAYAFMLRILINSILEWDMKSEKSDVGRKNFRVKLLYLLQEIIFYKSLHYVSSCVFNDNLSTNIEFTKIFGEDIGRALSWTRILSGLVEDEYDIPIDVEKYEKSRKNLKKLSSKLETLQGEELSKCKKEYNECKDYVESNQSLYMRYMGSMEAKEPARTFEFRPVTDEIL